MRSSRNDWKNAVLAPDKNLHASVHMQDVARLISDSFVECARHANEYREFLAVKVLPRSVECTAAARGITPVIPRRQAFARLWAAGIGCATVNPRAVRPFAEAMGRLEKTDGSPRPSPGGRGLSSPSPSGRGPG